MLKDITVEHEALDAVRGQLQFMQKITSRLPGMVFQLERRLDGSMFFPFASDAVEHLFGVKPEQARADAQPILAAILPQDRPLLMQALASSAESLTPMRVEFRVGVREGHFAWLFANAVPEGLAKGRVAWYGAVTDVTHEKMHAAMEERQRLMRDLHDGLGSHLIGALRIAQQQTMSREDVASQLRSAIDQLKITVDAMQETDGDIAAVLGAVRYRLTPRIQAAGITLNWKVGHLPALPYWGVRQSYQLQMILFEAFTNMVVHSGAKSAWMTAQKLDCEGKECIEIEVLDNGQGV